MNNINFSFPKIPALNHRKAGKFTEDPIKNLPQLSEKRLKPSWNDLNNQPKLNIDPKENPVGLNSFDLIKEINASKSNKAN